MGSVRHGAALSLVVAGFFTSCTASERAPAPPRGAPAADVVFENGNVYTNDDAAPRADRRNDGKRICSAKATCNSGGESEVLRLRESAFP